MTIDDVGCQLKVKCRPVRVDGVKGEIFTSKSSGIILHTSNGSSLVKVNHDSSVQSIWQPKGIHFTELSRCKESFFICNKILSAIAFKDKISFWTLLSIDTSLSSNPSIALAKSYCITQVQLRSCKKGIGWIYLRNINSTLMGSHRSLCKFKLLQMNALNKLFSFVVPLPDDKEYYKYIWRFYE